MNLHPCFMLYCPVWVKFVVGYEHNAAEHCELGEDWRRNRQYLCLHTLNCMCTCTGILLSVPCHTCCFTTITHLVKRWLRFIPVWAGYCYCMFQKHYFTCTVIFSQKWSFWEYCGSGPRILSDKCGKVTV